MTVLYMSRGRASSLRATVETSIPVAMSPRSLGARLMGVEGVLEREGEVVHLVARRLVDHTALLGRLPTSSRDFH